MDLMRSEILNKNRVFATENPRRLRRQGSNRSAHAYCRLNYRNTDPERRIKRPPGLFNPDGHGFVAQTDVVLIRDMAILNELVFPRLNMSLFHGLPEIC